MKQLHEATSYNRVVAASIKTNPVALPLDLRPSFTTDKTHAYDMNVSECRARKVIRKEIVIDMSLIKYRFKGIC